MTLALPILLALAAAPAPAPSPRPPGEPAPKASPAPAERRAFLPVNVRLEIKLTERRGEAEPATKLVSMTVADGRSGMVRSNGGMPGGPVLNVDAGPTIDDGKIRLNLGFEYNVSDGAPGAKEMRQVHEQFWVVLENGRPLVVSDATDPVGDRRLQVEVTATILR